MEMPDLYQLLYPEKRTMSFCKKINKEAWISKAGCENLKNQYLCFRRTFVLDHPENLSLRISAGWDFILYINGQEGGRGQFPDYPEHKTYTEISPVLLHTGSNTLAVLIYNPSEDFFAQIKGPAGLWINLLQDGQVILAADEQWKCRRHPVFRSGVISKVSLQLGYNVLADLNAQDNWTSTEFDDSTWENAAVIPYTPEISPRKIPPLVIASECSMASPVRYGNFRRGSEKATFALSVASDRYLWKHQSPGKLPLELPADSNYSGWTVIADLHEETTGLLEIECRAEAGTVIDISHGEHLDDGMVRCEIDGRNFTDRIITREGHNFFQLPFRRLGARYLQLNIRTKASFSLQLLGLRRVSAPLAAPPAQFNTDKVFSTDLHLTGVRTLKCCMHDHYEDCPWREQSLYSYDSRNQILFGYYVWGNYDFAAESLRLLGRGCQQDWDLNLCAPTHRSLVIPIFSMVWVSALLEYFQYSGDLSLLKEFAGQISGMGEHLFSQIDRRMGLLSLPAEKYQWNFYEWVPGLDQAAGTGLFHALHNLYACEMFRSISRIMTVLDQPEESEIWQKRFIHLQLRIREHFTTAGEVLKTSDAPEALRHQHTQYLGLYTGAVPPEKAESLFQTMTDDRDMISLSASPLPYMLRSLFEVSPDARRWGVKYIDRIFRGMLNQGATTFYETPDAGDAFNYAGSLCHAWSSIHILYHGAYVLGVTPLEPGFRRFQVRPYTCQFNSAEGEIPTPAGRIRIRWNKLPDGSVDLTVSHPAALMPVISTFPECPVHSIKTISLSDSTDSI